MYYLLMFPIKRHAKTVWTLEGLLIVLHLCLIMEYIDSMNYCITQLPPNGYNYYPNFWSGIMCFEKKRFLLLFVLKPFVYRNTWVCSIRLVYQRAHFQSMEMNVVSNLEIRFCHFNHICGKMRSSLKYIVYIIVSSLSMFTST